MINIFQILENEIEDFDQILIEPVKLHGILKKENEN